MFKVKRAIFNGLICMMTAFVFTPEAMADTRSHVWTYEYGTEPRGGAEIEYYFTGQHGGKDSSGTIYEHQIELEYGITDRWDIGMYQQFKKQGSESLDYEGFKLKTRYRFGDRGKFFLDPELYLEYENRTGDKEALEAKLILAKDIGDLNIAYNQIEEITFGRGGMTEHEYAVGISYPISHAFRLGLESMGSYTENEYAAGPTIAWSGGRFWANLGVLFGMSKNAADTQVRFLVGVPF